MVIVSSHKIFMTFQETMEACFGVTRKVVTVTDSDYLSKLLRGARSRNIAIIEVRTWELAIVIML